VGKQGTRLNHKDRGKTDRHHNIDGDQMIWAVTRIKIADLSGFKNLKIFWIL